MFVCDTTSTTTREMIMIDLPNTLTHTHTLTSELKKIKKKSGNSFGQLLFIINDIPHSLSWGWNKTRRQWLLSINYNKKQVKLISGEKNGYSVCREMTTNWFSYRRSGHSKNKSKYEIHNQMFWPVSHVFISFFFHFQL